MLVITRKYYVESTSKIAAGHATCGFGGMTLGGTTSVATAAGCRRSTEINCQLTPADALDIPGPSW